MLGSRVATIPLMARDPARNLAEVVDVDEQTGRLDPRLKPAMILTGTVVNQEGRPLAGARIRVVLQRADSAGPLGVIEQVATGANGAFEVKAICPRRQYELTATAAPPA